MPLKPDNPTHRDMSNKLDAKYGGQTWYDAAARPMIHGSYHAVRSLDQTELKNGLGSATIAPTVFNQGIRDAGVCLFKQDPVACSSAKDNFKSVATGIAQAASHTVRAFDNYDKEEWARAKDQLNTIGTGQPQTVYLKAYRESEEQKQQN